MKILTIEKIEDIMKKIISVLLILNSFAISQKGKELEYEYIDEPVFFTKSNFLEKSFSRNSLSKLRDPNITGGKISNFSQFYKPLFQ